MGGSRPLLAAYRRTGADPPFGDPRAHHGVAMEGYYWRLTHAATGTVVVALLGVSRDARGRSWGTVALAAHPGGFLRSGAVAHAAGDPRSLSVHADDGGPAVFAADEHGLSVDLGPDARLDARFAERVTWPHRVFGGVGPAHAVPGLSQYWHPHLLGARVEGEAQLDGRRVDLAGATAYAEKNWGRGGFPDAWWWGQAQGFARHDVCVAFAGGRAGVGPLQAVATALVARVGDEHVRMVRPLVPVQVEVGADGWRLRGRTARWAVELEGHARRAAPHPLPVPLPAERRNLDGGAVQHLAAELRLRVRRGRRTLFSGTSLLAGLERGTAVEADLRRPAGAPSEPALPAPA